MARTVFYAWQTDSPQPGNRNLIQKALEKAVSSINDELGLGPDGADRLEFDQYTAGLTGSSPITEAILEKIRAASAVIVDLTIVHSATTSAKDERHFLNPNATYEAGYAQRHHGHEKVIHVMNSEFGGRKQLLFDLSHRRVLEYTGPSGDSSASQVARRKARDELSKRLKKALSSRVR